MNSTNHLNSEWGIDHFMENTRLESQGVKMLSKIRTTEELFTDHLYFSESGHHVVKKKEKTYGKKKKSSTNSVATLKNWTAALSQGTGGGNGVGLSFKSKEK